MKLDFSVLGTLNTRGQKGTVGTPICMRLSASCHSGGKPGTRGDKTPSTPRQALLNVDMSPLSPIRPHFSDAPLPCVGGVSPPSPLVPNEKTKQANKARFNREAFEERAAIMEFEGGLMRADAEWLATQALAGDVHKQQAVQNDTW